jgi:alanyl-tRNA synthetase
MTSSEIRKSFLDFFREKQHTIVPSSSLLPDAPNLLFTNAGMNQFVPIFLEQQKPSWNPPRVADTQKCIRAGGKHNDLEDVGLDTYHHTFFEMLGNWSFGDYFKKEAIEWAWELVVGKWNFPAKRVYATVYCPQSRHGTWDDELKRMIHGAFTGTGIMEWSDKTPNDQNAIEIPDRESAQHWARVFCDAGLSELETIEHIVAGDRNDNFWMMGDTGPCGPCSELHVDLTPDGDTRGALVNKDDPRCIEIWNLVFIQFNAQPIAGVADPGRIEYVPLAHRHVDTGMGFERVTAIIQDTKNFSDFSGTISNYETDIFRPIFNELEKLSGKKYTSTLPDRSQPSTLNSQQATDVAFRVLADHIRTLSFAIADGVIPSNEGRGYVLRRILRRAVRYGRSLGFHEPFFFKLVDVVAKTMGDVFSEVREKQEQIKEMIKREEESFNATLDNGIQIFETYLRGIVSAIERSSIVQTQFLCKDSGDLGFRGRYSAWLPTTRFAQPSGWDVISGYSRYGDQYPTRLRMLMEKLHEASSAIEANSLIDAIVSAARSIEADFAFKLYDTYGFPIDLTQLMARERGLTVDVVGFEKLMEEQRERGRKAQKKSIVTIDDVHEAVDKPTDFVGYDGLEAECSVLNFGDNYVQVDRSPLYAEMGGQVGDSGKLILDKPIEHGAEHFLEFRIIDTVQRRGIFYLILPPDSPQNIFTDWAGNKGTLKVDVERRRLIQGHHTVTHLLHWALHQLVSKDATQKGSYVGPDKLTFDFSSAALTKQQVRDVEKLVNEKINEGAPVSWTKIPFADAKKRKEIQQFFGEKYGDKVRVVQIGGEPTKLNGYSMELCGGTHVTSTSEIGAFRIVKEEAIAAGIRRIEAVAGGAAREWAQHEAVRQQEKFENFARKKSDIAALPAFADAAQTAEMLQQIDARVAHLEKLDVEVRDWEKQHAKSAEAEIQSRAASIASELAASNAGKDFLVTEVPNADGKLLQAVADALKSKIKGPIFLAGVSGGRVALIASVPKELTSKFQANKLIQEIAPIVGGKGGGRPENAQGAGNDPAKLEEALAKAKRLLA